MTRTSPSQLSFASGEISPLLHGRSDFVRYQSGLRQCRGFLPTPQGPVVRAPGTRYAGVTNGRAHLIPFIFSETDAYHLEFTYQTMRVWRGGALVDGFQLAAPWSEEQARRVQYMQSADRLYFAGVDDIPPQTLSRYDHDNWTLAQTTYTGGPFRTQNLDESQTIQASAATGSTTLTANADLFVAAHAGAFWRLAESTESDTPYWTGQTSVSAGDRMRYDGKVYEVVSGSETGVNPPTHDQGQWLDQQGGVTWRHVYSDGAGVVRIDAVSGPRSAVATVITELPSSVVSTPTYRWAEGAWSDYRGWPTVIGFHEQRMVLAGAASDSQRIFFSTIASYLDHTPSTAADGAFALDIVSGSNTVSQIRRVISSENGLHVQTEAEMFLERLSQRQGRFSLDTVRFASAERIVASDVPPLVVAGAPFVIPKSGKKLYYFDYSYDTDRVTAQDKTVAAEHILHPGVVAMGWRQEPMQVLWLALADGSLASFTWDKDQQVEGWSVMRPEQMAGGRVRSLAMIPDGAGGELVALCMERFDQHWLEFMAPIFGVAQGAAPSMRDAWHAFAGLSYAGDAATQLTGLHHLEGREVAIWCDHGTLTATVTGGAVTLTQPVTWAVAGLAPSGQSILTLDVAAGARDGGSVGRTKHVRAIGARLLNTWGGSVSVVEFSDAPASELDAAANPSETLRDQGETLLDAPQMFSGVVSVRPSMGYAQEFALRIEPDGIAPITVCGVTPIVNTANG